MSSDVAIRIDGVGKRYRIGTEKKPYGNLRESLTGLARNPLAPFRGRGRMTEENSFWALKDVGFEVKRGEVVGIIGRNGAGKSTLLKVLSRITEPTTGEIMVRGRVGSLLEVGTGFHPELTGRENIFMNGAILGMSQAEIRGKFDEIVAFSEVGKFLDTPVKQYSSGMYTRLAFAVAAHLEPEVLVVDEVLAVGDAAFQKKCLGKMQDVAGEGRTVLFVSHNMAAVRSLCHNGIVLSQGRIVADGPVESALHHYLKSGSGDDLTCYRAQGPLDGPGRIGSITIRDGRGTEIDGECDVRAGLRLEFGLETASGVPDGYLAFNLRDQYDNIVLAGNSKDGGLHSVPAGASAWSARYPSHLLMPGTYRLTATLSSTYAGPIDRHRDVLAIDVVDTKRPMDRRGGHIGLLADWSADAAQAMGAA